MFLKELAPGLMHTPGHFRVLVDKVPFLLWVLSQVIQLGTKALWCTDESPFVIGDSTGFYGATGTYPAVEGRSLYRSVRSIARSGRESAREGIVMDFLFLPCHQRPEGLTLNVRRHGYLK
ncbi:hypothetical protein ES703_82215 [subsurface metagenome]